MKLKHLIAGLGLLALVVTALGGLPVTTYAAPLAQSGNLLQNPSMDDPYNKCGSGITGSMWGCWYTEIAKPNDASGLQYALKPYFDKEANLSGQYPQLIRSGAASQHVGLQFDPWIGGLDQTVTVPANTPLRFCAWSRIRISNNSLGKDNSESVTAYNGRSKVGISTTGDGGNVVWSGEINPHDTWGQVCVEATSGPQGKVIVYTSNDWRGGAAVHVDAWWDDAELIVTGPQPTATPDPGNQPNVAQPTTAPVQPQPTVPPVTNPDGSTVHTVVSGDTLYGIAFQYNLTLDELLQLNPSITRDSLLSLGQQIVIKAGTGSQPPAAQPTAAAPDQQPTPGGTGVVTDTQAPVQPTVAPTAVANNATSQLCVHAFDDADGDGLPSGGDAAMAGVQFSVANAQGSQAASYTTDTSTEPHCFTDLQPGSYTVAVQPAPGTVATSDKRWGVALSGGRTVNINFGSRSDANAPSQPTDSQGSGDTQKPSASNSGLGGLLTFAIGLIVLVVAGVLGAFYIARRRA